MKGVIKWAAIHNSEDQNLTRLLYNQNSQFHINSISHKLLKNLEILVLELDCIRDLNCGAMVHPTDLKIMKIILKEWLKTSGVKRVEVLSKFADQKKAEDEILEFLGVP